jgi:4-amino-4-deoxy-L-arabinose transferase-like glycosyltransferase
MVVAIVPSSNQARWVMLVVVLAAASVLIWGLRRDLPYVSNVDEPIYVVMAIRMASTGDLNPHWFGNPGSTMFYPLAFLYRFWFAVTSGGPLLRADQNLELEFARNLPIYYLLGRLLSLSYALLSIPLTYQIGRRIFNRRVGLGAVWLHSFYPLVITHAKLVRTDAAATFFTLLFFWFLLNLWEQPASPYRNQLLVGLFAGLSVATRYFMIALVPILVATNGIYWLRHGSRGGLWRLLFESCVCILAVFVAFALSSPFVILDANTALHDVVREARDTHLGADGLSPLGNLWFYLATAIPQSISWPQWLLAGVGCMIALWKKKLPAILLVAYVAIFLGGISRSSLHWSRWIIQTLPILALLAAYATDQIVLSLAHLREYSPQTSSIAKVMAVLALSASPLYTTMLVDNRLANESTRILARKWIIDILPKGSRILQERYSAPLAGADFEVIERGTLSAGKTWDGYRK